MKGLVVCLLILCLAVPAQASAGGAGKYLAELIVGVEPSAREYAVWNAFRLRLATLQLTEEQISSFYDSAIFAIRSGKRLPSLSELRGLARGVRHSYPLFTRALKEVLTGRPVSTSASFAVLWRDYRPVVLIGGILISGVLLSQLGTQALKKILPQSPLSKEELHKFFQETGDNISRQVGLPTGGWD